MNVFYGFISYLWFFGVVFCMTTGGTGWDLLWWSLYVTIFAYVGKGVVYTIGFVYKMQTNPAFFNNIIDEYFYYVMQEREVRDYINHKR